MKIFKTTICWLISLTWCFPQFVIGLIGFLFLFPHTDHFIHKGCIYTVKKGNWGGCSFGMFIFIDTPYSEKQDYQDFINHEAAHNIQSLVLGVFWIFVIGIPSLCWAAFGQDLINESRKKEGLHPYNYEWFYTEKNAEWIRKKYFTE